MSYKIICFGDSNTYGYDARGFMGGRLSKNARWTGLLDEDSDLEIVNCGENGREIPTDRWDLGDLDAILDREAPFDLLVIMLGSNDLLTMYRSGISKITQRMARLLYHILDHPSIDNEPSRILLIAPPPTDLGRIDPMAANYDRISSEFGSAYGSLAATAGVHFVDAGQWNIELGHDGVHFTEKGHRTFAEHMRVVLKEILT